MQKPPSSTVRTAALTAATPVQILGPSPNRVGVLFAAASGAAGDTYSVANHAPSAAGDGLTVGFNGVPLDLRLDVHGDCVQKAWFARASANMTIAFLEVMG